MQVTGFRSDIQDIHFNVTQCHTSCLGALFGASLIRGRGTVVCYVVDPRDKKRFLALKTALQDLTQVTEQDVIVNRPSERLNPDATAPFKKRKLERDGLHPSLDAIRGFLDDDVKASDVENRVLAISIFGLGRPVKYFWGVHDFVRGLRGALLGHQYLTSMGILHGDINENSIILGLRPEGERGYLIDHDMAIQAAQAEKPTPAKLSDLRWNSSLEKQADDKDKSQVEALRTGTFPYMSYNVFWGGRHTHLDDVESFLYVLLLFFFSYAGPLSVSELREADKARFVPSVGSRRPSHMRDWPKEYADWTDGNAWQVGSKKYYCIWSADDGRSITQSPEFLTCLENNWPKEIHRPIARLIEKSFKYFQRSATPSGTNVSHVAFIKVLDKWLDKCAHLEDKYSNCPFMKGMFRQSSFE